MTTSSRLSTSLPQTIEAIEATRLSAITRLYCLSCSSRALAVIPSFYVASGRRPVVMLSILSLAAIEAIEATRLPASTPGPSRASAGRRRLVAVGAAVYHRLHA